jgi:hypothetical protein
MRLAALMMETGEFHPALQLVGTLLTEVKRLDDKLLLVDVHLIESRLHHHLLNTPKSKAALTAARSAANSVHVPPSLQVGQPVVWVPTESLQNGRASVIFFSHAFVYGLWVEHNKLIVPRIESSSSTTRVLAGRDRSAKWGSQCRGEGL